MTTGGMNTLIICVLIIYLGTSNGAMDMREPFVKALHRRLQKRQSDQRLAELETLLALQRYRHQSRAQPGYGAFDFSVIGRKKKSTFSIPPKLANFESSEKVSESWPESETANNVAVFKRFQWSRDNSFQDHPRNPSLEQ